MVYDDDLENNIEDFLSRVYGFPQMSMSDKILTLKAYPNFKLIYKFKNFDTKAVEEAEEAMRKEQEMANMFTSMRLRSKSVAIPVMDSNSVEFVGYVGQLCFDSREKKYFRFGHGYLSDAEVACEPRIANSLDQYKMGGTVQIIPSVDVPLQNVAEADYSNEEAGRMDVAGSSECVEDERVEDEIRPRSPIDNNSEYMMVTVEEAEMIENFETIASDYFEKNIETESKAARLKELHGGNDYSLCNKLEDRKAYRASQARQARIARRESDINDRRKMDKIAIFKKNLMDMDVDDINPSDIQKTSVSIEVYDEIHRCVKYKFGSTEIIASKVAAVKSALEIPGYCYKGMYFYGKCTMFDLARLVKSVDFSREFSDHG